MNKLFEFYLPFSVVLGVVFQLHYAAVLHGVVANVLLRVIIKLAQFLPHLLYLLVVVVALHASHVLPGLIIVILILCVHGILLVHVQLLALKVASHGCLELDEVEHLAGGEVRAVLVVGLYGVHGVLIIRTLS